ncbi:sensor domain-containing diguanylate cyclase [Clostridium vincentii]|uniref:Putative diguanylate cyclase AdrA n=1 Tax=Clostridium vincentii TaxID=52704 RepID=A0A2T0BIG8_9CLOT|nr:FIST N-terminal domain-containing protein [Clostridium vincentii]PRR83689.1 putative diguanylate cyclase AdrA [Clostridium vincentii]
MKQYGYIYNNFNKMKAFVNTMDISKSDTILLQIMTGIIEVEFIKKLIDELIVLLPNSEIIGTTTSGEIYEGNIYTNSTTLSFTIFEQSKVKTALINNKTTEYELGLYIGNKSVEEDTKLMIMFANGLLISGDDILKGINSVNNDVIVCGGKAGDNDSFKETFVFTKEGITNKGIAVAFISGDQLSITTESSFCWSSIGKEMTITKAHNNTVFTIDNVTAVDIFKKYLGEDVVKNLLMYSTEIPLIIKKHDMEIARVVSHCSDDGSISFFGNVEIGDKVQFGYVDIGSLTVKPLEIFNYLKDKSLEAIFVYSCSVRRALLQKGVELEISPLVKIAPTFGFFTYGEFFSTNCSNELLNLTMTILGLSECGDTCKKSIVELDNNENLNKHFFEHKELVSKKMFINLVNEVTKELKEANEILEEQKSKIEKIKDITNSIMDINMQLLSSGEFGSLLQMILDKALEIISGANMGSILIMENNELHYKATKGYVLDNLEKATYKLEDTHQYRLCGKYGLFEPIIITDIEHYPLGSEESHKDWLTIATEEPSEILSCVIGNDGEIMGLINIFSTTKQDKFNDYDKALIKHLANDISIAYKYSKLLEDTIYMSRYDGLTKVLNRHYFRLKLAHVINKAKVLHKNIIICELDLNNLKVTNDTFGHEAGDESIKYLTDIFRTRIGANNIMGRTGGDEFELVFTNKNKSEVIALIDHIYDLCKTNPIDFNGQPIEISFAYGLAELYVDSEDIGELLKLADNRMYEKKRIMKAELRNK